MGADSDVSELEEEFGEDFGEEVDGGDQDDADSCEESYRIDARNPKAKAKAKEKSAKAKKQDRAEKKPSDTSKVGNRKSGGAPNYGMSTKYVKGVKKHSCGLPCRLVRHIVIQTSVPHRICRMQPSVKLM